MKLTTLFCCCVLIALGICAAVYALSGLNLPALVSCGNAAVYRCLLSLGGVAALWHVFWLIAFRPTRPLR